MERDHLPQPFEAPFESGGGFVNNADSDVERNYWITDTGANAYELSPETVENPTVRHYIGLLMNWKHLLLQSLEPQWVSDYIKRNS